MCIKDFVINVVASVTHQLLTESNQNLLKMKLIILVALSLVAVVVADAPEPPKILKSEFDQTPEGGYVFSYDTENGISRAEQGEVKDIVDEENKPHRVVVSRGSYSYTNADGKNEFVAYYADETGYHAEGDSIPKQA